MAKRSSYGQRKHDAEVRHIANSLQHKGWNVKADIPGFEQPKPIGLKGKIPDIVAQKGGAKKIIEIETPETISKDKKQHETFRRSVAQQERTSFEVKEA
jgi:Holliday junction resolvase